MTPSLFKLRHRDMRTTKTNIITLFMLGLVLLTGMSMVKDKLIKHEVCSIKNNTFSGGERLVYEIYYNWKFVWLPAGQVTFDVKEDSTDYFVEIRGKTYESYNSFFEVDDYFYSRFDKESLLPKEFVRIVHEGKYRRFDSLSFQQDSLVATAFHGRTRSGALEIPMPMDGCMHDMISILYHIRNIDFGNLDKGTRLPVEVMFDKEVFPLNVHYKGKKKKKIKGLGKHTTIYFEPEVVAGEVFDEETTMKIYASDDGNRLPLLIESPVSIGSVKAVLSSTSGLKDDIQYRKD